MCSARNARAEFFSSCWSGLNEKSTLASYLRGGPRHGPPHPPLLVAPGYAGTRLESLAVHAIGANLLGETEHALADDVLLDLRRARVDRARAGPQEGIRPARANS